MNITSILLFIILLLVVGADFLFTKLRKKKNADLLKIETKQEEKETKKTVIKNKKIQFIIVLAIWAILLVFDLNDSTIEKPLIYNYNELFIVALVLLFYIVFSINASLKINNLDSNKNKAREVVFIFFTVLLSVLTYYINVISNDYNKNEIRKFEVLDDNGISTYYEKGFDKEILLVNDNNLETIRENKLDIINEEYYENKFYFIYSKFDKNGRYPTITETWYNFYKDNNELFNKFQSILGTLTNFLPRKNFSRDYDGGIKYNGLKTDLSDPIFWNYHFNTIKINSIKPSYFNSYEDRLYYHSNYVGPYDVWRGTGYYYYSNRFGKYFHKSDVDYEYNIDKSQPDLNQKVTRNMTGYNVSVNIIENPLPSKYLKLPKAVRLKNIDKLMNDFDIDKKMFDKFYVLKNVQAISKNFNRNYYKVFDKYGTSISLSHLFSTKINYISNSIQWKIRELTNNNFITKNNNVFGFIVSFLLVVYALRVVVFVLIKLLQGLSWSFKTYFE